MVADLCQVVLSCFQGEKAKRRHMKTRQMVTFSCFRIATFRSATWKYDTFHVSPFHLLFVVSLPGGAKGRHAKWWLFRVFAWRPIAPPGKDTTNRGKNAKGRHAKTNQMMTFSCFRKQPFAPPHKSMRHSMCCVFGYCLSYLCLARRKIAMRKHKKVIIWQVFAWRPFAFSPRKHVYTTWHKSATITKLHLGR